MDSTNVINQIKELILSKIDTQANIEIINETYKHLKHKRHNKGKYHIKLNIYSKKLSFMSMMSSHKEVYKAVENLMPYIHSLSIKIKPELINNV